MTTDLFTPVAGLSIAVEGARDARRHFRAEYGPPLASDRGAPARAAVRVTFAAATGEACARGGHKTVGWTIALGDPDAHPLTVTIGLSGRPRRFALSMVQGFVVEPLVSVAAARAGYVLLPAGALVAGGGAVILLGRSGAGKTSVIARVLAGGGSALGDDQVLLDTAGAVHRWPRRLRVYPDLRLTAPEAVRRLPPGRRLALGGRSVLRAATRGWVAPSLALQSRDLGAEPVTVAVPAQRIVVLERGGSASAIVAEAISPEAVRALAREILREQRERFAALAGARWDGALGDTEQREQAVLAPVLAGLAAERWVVPAAWPAATAVRALAARLGVDG